MFYLRVVILVVFLVLDRGLVSGAGAAPTKMTSPTLPSVRAWRRSGSPTNKGSSRIWHRGASDFRARRADARCCADFGRHGYRLHRWDRGARRFGGGDRFENLAVLTNRVTYDLVARPEIKRAEDLRGKRFGVTSIGGTLWMGGVLGLEHWASTPAATISAFSFSATRWSSARRWRKTASMPRCSIWFLASGLPKRDFRFWPSCTRSNLPIASTSVVARQRLYPKKSPAHGEFYEGGDGGDRLRALRR